MIFYHHTTKENAEKILETTDGLGIYGSCFDIVKYMEMLFTESSLEKPNSYTPLSISLTNEYIVDTGGDMITYQVKWLGSGLYCFTETNLDATQQYNNKKLDTILKIIIKSTECTENEIFNMTNRENTKKLIEFIEHEIPQIAEFLSQSYNEYIKQFQEILLSAIRSNFKGIPHAAGILIELYLVIYNTYKIIKCSFILGGSKPSKPMWIDEYVAIKDLNIIDKVELV